MKFRVFVLALALSACGRPDPVRDDEAAAALPEPIGGASASPTGGPPSNSVAPEPVSSTPTSLLPVALHGRWGLTPADCTSTRSDAKGLLAIGPGELRFYESRAVPSPGIQTSPNSVSGNFAFTGEGQEWTKYQTLQVEGSKLKRTERDPLASFTYARC